MIFSLDRCPQLWINENLVKKSFSDGLQLMLAYDFDVTDPSDSFKKLYGSGVIDDVSFVTYFREYLI